MSHHSWDIRDRAKSELKLTILFGSARFLRERKTLIFPEILKDPAFFMGMMWVDFAYLYAKKKRPMSQFALLVKTETIRLINQKMCNLKRATTTENLTAISYLSIGVMVSAFVVIVRRNIEHFSNAMQTFGGASSADESRVHDAGIQALLA
jgi:hypothetical protein